MTGVDVGLFVSGFVLLLAAMGGLADSLDRRDARRRNPMARRVR